MAAVRDTYSFAEPITGGNSKVRAPYVGAEPLTGGNSRVRLPYVGAEPLTGGNSVVRCALIGLEVIYRVPEEGPVATAVLPVFSPIKAPLIAAPLPGLTWSAHKKPMFRTMVNSAVSGKEIRTARMQYPIYQFELTFEFLDSRDNKTQLETLMGFFMTQLGSWGSWLFQDWTDYKLRGQQIGVADGGTTGFTVVRTMGGFTDPVGQIDLSQLFNFVAADVNPTTNVVSVPAHGLETGYGPVQLTTAGTLPAGLLPLTNYWIISTGTNTLKFAISYANALAGTAVDITDAGTGTFLASNSVAVYDNGAQVAPSAYVVTMPNKIVFDVAPTNTHIITIDCKFYFVCRFMDDIEDYEQFMYNLWTLQTMAFQSCIQ